ncbi:MAG: hypothetical protein K2G93_04985, partial [Rikenella sp.]|nr:hypothetical protein [Rikenella sp.]
PRVPAVGLQCFASLGPSGRNQTKPQQNSLRFAITCTENPQKRGGQGAAVVKSASIKNRQKPPGKSTAMQLLPSPDGEIDSATKPT